MLYRQLKCIRAHEGRNMVYLNNPKTGCSTVKGNLWRALAPATYRPGVDVHDLEASPFDNDVKQMTWLRTAQVFTFVRNPYTRIVSAYLNKIAGKSEGTWISFARRHGFAKDAEVSFDAFVEAISSDSPDTLDAHWRPQHLHLAYPFIRPNFIGHLEDMDADLSRVLPRFLGATIETPARRAAHGTSARDQVAVFLADPATRQRVETLYALDFSYFGYSHDLAAARTPPHTAEFEDHEHPALDMFSALARANKRPERLRLLDRLGTMFDAHPDPMISDWLLCARIETADPSRAARMVQQNAKAILSGHEFLKRTAASVAASAGRWSLTRSIAQAAISRR